MFCFCCLQDSVVNCKLKIFSHHYTCVYSEVNIQKFNLRSYNPVFPLYDSLTSWLIHFCVLLYALSLSIIYIRSLSSASSLSGPRCFLLSPPLWDSALVCIVTLITQTHIHKHHLTLWPNMYHTHNWPPDPCVHFICVSANNGSWEAIHCKLQLDYDFRV